MKQELELKSILSSQEFKDLKNGEILLESAKTCARGFVQVTEGVAVISDFHENISLFIPENLDRFFLNFLIVLLITVHLLKT